MLLLSAKDQITIGDLVAKAIPSINKIGEVIMNNSADIDRIQKELTRSMEEIKVNDHNSNFDEEPSHKDYGESIDILLNAKEDLKRELKNIYDRYSTALKEYSLIYNDHIKDAIGSLIRQIEEVESNASGQILDVEVQLRFLLEFSKD